MYAHHKAEMAEVRISLGETGATLVKKLSKNLEFMLSDLSVQPVPGWRLEPS